MSKKLEKIFKSKATLRFQEARYNQEYDKKSYSSLKKLNFIFALTLVFFSLLFLVWVLIMFNTSQQTFSDLNITYDKISNTDIDPDNPGDIMVFWEKLVIIKKLWLNLKNSSSNITNEILNLNNNDQNINEENDKFLIINDENNNNNNNNNNVTNNFSKYIHYNEKFPLDYTSLKDMLRRILFSRHALFMMIIYIVLNFSSLLCSIFMQKFLHLKINFFCMMMFLGINFHILSGIFRTYYLMETEWLFLVISIQLFIQIIIILKVKISWMIILLSNLCKTIFEILFFYLTHFEFNQILLFYFIVCALGSFLCIIISYHKEVSSKSKFFWNSKTKFKEYLFNLLYNIDQGFISFKNNKIIFMNRFMKKILKNNHLIDIKDLDDIRDFFCEKAFIEKIPQFESTLKNDDSRMNLNQINNNISYDRINHLFEILLENFTELNDKLPEQMLNELSIFLLNPNDSEAVKKKEFHNNDFNIVTNKLTLANLFEILQKNKHFIKNDSFVFIGKINFKTAKNSKISGREDYKGDKKYNIFYHNQYELRARILKGKDNDRMEIILNDVSVLIQKERAKAIDQCRSMYLLKTAHEFMNPINSSMELINIIEENLDKDNQLKKQEILGYLKNLYYIMYNFLKDFTYFCEMKSFCNVCNTFESCKNCSKNDYCKTCQNCRSCKNNSIRDVNLQQVLNEILEIFSNITKFEEKRGINFIINYNISELFVKFNPEYLKSILFNIFYYFYKNSDSDDIEITISYSVNKANDKPITNKKEYPSDINIISGRKTKDKLGMLYKNYFPLQTNTFPNPDGYPNNNTLVKNNYEGFRSNNFTQKAFKDNLFDTFSFKNTETIEISVRSNNIFYELEKKRFDKNKDILTNPETYENIEIIGFDEFNKSFQIYIGILLCNLSNSNLFLHKYGMNGSDYKFDLALSYKNTLNHERLWDCDLLNIENENFDNLLGRENSFNLNKNNTNNKKQPNSDDASDSSEEIVKFPDTQENLINNIKSTANKEELVIENNKPFLIQNATNPQININANFQINNSNYIKINKKLLQSFINSNKSQTQQNLYSNYTENITKQISNQDSINNIQQLQSLLNRNETLNNESAKLNTSKTFSIEEKNFAWLKMQNTFESLKKSRSTNLQNILNFAGRKQKSLNFFINEVKECHSLEKARNRNWLLKPSNTVFKDTFCLNIQQENLSNNLYKRNKSMNNESKSTLEINNDYNFNFNYLMISKNKNNQNFNNPNRINIGTNQVSNFYSKKPNEPSYAKKPLLYNIPKVYSGFNISDKKNSFQFNNCQNLSHVKNNNGSNDSYFRFNKTNKKNNSAMLNNTQSVSRNNSEKKMKNTILNFQPSAFSKKKVFKRILVIDDELLIRSIIKRYFTKINITNQLIEYLVVEAANVFEAINTVYNMYLEKKYIDFVIIDEQMPYIKGSHMIQLFKTIADENNFYRIKFISYSAFNTKAMKQYLKEKGADYTINKPISYEDFVLLVNELEDNI